MKTLNEGDEQLTTMKDLMNNTRKPPQKYLSTCINSEAIVTTERSNRKVTIGSSNNLI